MVDYIFSDKTGTLTQNVMDFKKFSAGMQRYGVSDPKRTSPEEISRDEYASKQGITNVNFQDDRFWDIWQGNKDPALEDFVRILAVCHTIIVDTEKNEDGSEAEGARLTYNASSPDELALTNAARYFGLIFNEHDIDNNVVVRDERTGKVDKYELLDIIEFTSARKRMTVVVRAEDGRILCMTKGADSVIIPRLRTGQEELVSFTEQVLLAESTDGLSTLLPATNEDDPGFYESWHK